MQNVDYIVNSHFRGKNRENRGGNEIINYLPELKATIT